MNRRLGWFVFVVVCAGLLLGVGSSVAQVNTAKLSGQITDPQGLAVRGVKIAVTNLATDAERTTTSDEEGRYFVAR